MNAIKGELCNGSQGNVVGSKVVRGGRLRKSDR